MQVYTSRVYTCTCTISARYIPKVVATVEHDFRVDNSQSHKAMGVWLYRTRYSTVTYIFLRRMKDAVRRVVDMSIPDTIPTMRSIVNILSRLCEV